MSCTRVHGFEEKTKFNVPGYMNLKKKIFLCVAQAVVVGRHKKKIFFGNFFQHVKKLIDFGNFVKIKVAKFKLNHLG